MKSLIFCVTVFVFCSGFLLAMSSRVLSRWNIWWRCPGLNGRPAAYESAALPTELHRQKGFSVHGHRIQE